MDLSCVKTVPNYKLTYFQMRGRAEIVRMVFAAAGVQYEDHRIEMSQWSSIKPNMPFGMLPILEFDGNVLCQSKAIARYLAHKYKLAGKSDLDHARADMIVDCLDDATKPFFYPAFVMNPDADAKAAIAKKYCDEQLPGFLADIEKMLTENKNGDGFFVGDKLTWADLAFVDFCGLIGVVGGDTQLPSYPKLQAARDRFEKIPKVAEWLAKRPPMTLI